MRLATFHVSATECALPLERVRELIQPPPVTRVPGAAAALRGVVNLRGKTIPVMDVAVRIGAASPGDDAAPASSGRSCLIVVESEAGGPCALAVDGVPTLEDVPANEIEPPRRGVLGAGDWLAGFAAVEGRLVLVLDVERLLDPEAVRRSRPLARQAPDAPGATPEVPSPAPAPPEPETAHRPAPEAGLQTVERVAGRGAGSVRPERGRSGPERAEAPRRWETEPSRRGAAGAEPARPRTPPSVHLPPFQAPPPPPARALPSSFPVERAAARAESEAGALAPAGPWSRSPLRLGLALAVAVAGVALVARLVVGGGEATGTKAAARGAGVVERAGGGVVRAVPAAQVDEVAPTARAEERVMAHLQGGDPAAAPAPRSASPDPAATPAPHPASPERVAAAAPGSASPDPERPAPRRVAPPGLPPRRAPSPPPGAPRAGEIFEVSRGDTLWKIAGQLLGDPHAWPLVHAANRAAVPDPDLIHPGQRIVVPAPPAPGAAAGAGSPTR